MKVVILAGGLGTRISEESHLKPKPMIEVGEMPIIWHIMKTYSHYGYNDFIICCGYKGYVIKEYFANYYLHRSDVTFDFTAKNKMTVISNVAEPWKVTLIDTGLNTMTGGRVKRIQKFIGNERFMLTYGDGVADINIRELENFHINSGKLATISAIQIGGRFGVIEIEQDSSIMSFREKTKDDGGWINGGYMVFEPGIFDLIENDQTVLERFPLEEAARLCQLNAYKHHGFWQCMDTLRDKILLDELWQKKKSPWKVWKD